MDHQIPEHMKRRLDDQTGRIQNNEKHLTSLDRRVDIAFTDLQRIEESLETLTDLSSELKRRLEMLENPMPTTAAEVMIHEQGHKKRIYYKELMDQIPEMKKRIEELELVHTPNPPSVHSSSLFDRNARRLGKIDRLLRSLTEGMPDEYQSTRQEIYSTVEEIVNESPR